MVKDFEEKSHKQFGAIRSAAELTSTNLNKIRKQLNSNAFGSVESPDISIVLFGSIARNECTSNSDVDWTVLIDGQADPYHATIGSLVESSLGKLELAKPGVSGLFGKNTFSHNLLHYIGGQDDTNHNLTRRILLLLESCPLNETETGSAYDRVLRAVIHKYIENDSGFQGVSGKENVPRFLLNDLIRFWRTMCVDFAYKQIEEQGQKWGLRNIKLRMSRRLIFVKGLLICGLLYKSDIDKDAVKEEIFNFVKAKPLDFLVDSFNKKGISNEIIMTCLKTYDEFLGILNDGEYREHLKGLKMHEAYGDEKFEDARALSHEFQASLNNVFLDQNNIFGEFAIKYGIF
jgi:predicted nucleotidyltransferase